MEMEMELLAVVLTTPGLFTWIYSNFIGAAIAVEINLHMLFLLFA
jgi:hypothetical protein